jgi:preprotein translocase subunit SecA
LERNILLQIIDERWRNHLQEMDYLRQGIHLRGFAQIDPLVAYKNEGFNMFGRLIQNIWEEFGRYIFHVELQWMDDHGQSYTFDPKDPQGQNLVYSGGPGSAQPSALRQEASAAEGGGVATAEPAKPHVKSEREKLGRNDRCWCGSGKKFKNCHGK